MTPLDIALDYLARGWNPVPVEFGSKKPVGLAWQTRTLTAETASQYFNGAALNVGVVLGPSSQGLTDVDLDCPEAIIIAPYVLPPTSARFGRGSKRDSHYLFVTDLAGHCDKAVLTFRAGATMLVELRIGGAAGAQTVFPGSMHESGQAIIWEEDGKPAEVEGATLRQRVALLASCCLVARSWPKEGARHECALALGGSLSRAGLTPADIRRVAEAIGQAAGDPEAYDRGNAAHDAAEAHTKGERAYGFPRLAELISPEAAKQVADWLEYTGDESALGESRPRQVDLLIDLTKKAVLFHDSEGATYADIEVNGHRETWPVESEGFRRWLLRSYYEIHQRVPNADAMANALALVAAKAAFDGTEQQIRVRVGHYDDQLYLDLCDDSWRAVEIDSDGWRISDCPPVRFTRWPGMLPLPIPQRGGSVQALRDLINVKADDDFILVIAWLLAALRDQWSYPVLVVTGQHGSAKSTLLKILRRLIDPHRADLRVPPKNADDLYVTAARSHVMAYDNLRTIADWLSDGFARIATGTAYVKRKLYTDQDETLVVAKKPIALNGITEIVGAADLGDRSIFVTATPIEKKDRKTEEEIWTLFERVHPAILGALLDAVVQGLGRLAEVRLDELPRMADFARWGTACEGAYAPRRGAFMTAYAGNRAAAVNSMIEGDAVAGAVLRVRRPWAGPLHELLSDLNSIVVDQQARGRSWPTSPRGLGDALREAAPLLRERGVSVEAPLKTDKTRTWRVTDADEKRPQVMDELQNSPNSPNSPTGGKDGGETASTP